MKDSDMESGPSPAIALLPLDVEIVRKRLEFDDFSFDRLIAGREGSVAGRAVGDEGELLTWVRDSKSRSTE